MNLSKLFIVFSMMFAYSTAVIAADDAEYSDESLPTNTQDSNMIGSITIFAGNFAPRGYAFCDGQLLAVPQNSLLFSILGTKYGGDGRQTFALPNLKEAEKALGGARYIINIDGYYPSRK